jgi:hypothetical protein
MRKHVLIIKILSQEVVSLLQRVQKLMNSNVVPPRSMNVVFKRIDFIIKKKIVTQLIVR